MKEAKVSVIIPGHNAQSYLRMLFNALANLNYKNFEVIYVDDGSSDRSLDIAKGFKCLLPLKILALKDRKGASAARNIGARWSHPDTKYYSLLDVDVVPTPDYLRTLVDVLEKEKTIGMDQSLILDAKKTKKIQWGRTKILPLTYSFVPIYENNYSKSKYAPIAYARSASTVIRKQIFTELNGFDEKIPFLGEDLDLSWRCWLTGYMVVMVPKSVVYHFGGSMKLDQHYKKLINYKHILRAMIKCLQIRNLLPAIMIKMGYNVLKTKNLCYIPLKDWNWIIDAFKERAKIQSVRKIKDSELLSYFYESFVPRLQI